MDYIWIGIRAFTYVIIFTLIKIIVPKLLGNVKYKKDEMGRTYFSKKKISYFLFVIAVFFTVLLSFLSTIPSNVSGDAKIYLNVGIVIFCLLWYILSIMFGVWYIHLEPTQILFYKTDNGEVRVEILLYQENLWLTQAKMAELFEVQKAAISKHLKNIFTSGELQEEAVVSKMETTAADGKRYNTSYYNLDAIIAVGYRVNSKKATMFRIWANRVLKEFIIKGYVTQIT